MSGWVFAAAVALTLDQGTKLGVLGRDLEPSSGPWPRLRLVMNPRMGAGLVRDPRGLALLWGLAVASTVILLDRYPPFQAPAAPLGLGAALGGATGNLIDRIWRGAVVDFIDLRVWPVFNLADVAIVGGLGVALCAAW